VNNIVPCEQRYKFHVIAFCGLATAGKTTAADYLVDEYGADRVRFAAPLWSMLHPLGFTHEQLWGEEKRKPCTLLDGKTPEFALVQLGLFIRKEFGADFLVKRVTAALGELSWLRHAYALGQYEQGMEVQHTYVVIDDLRCVNEREALRAFALTHPQSIRVHIVNVKRAAALAAIDPETLSPQSVKYKQLEGEHLLFLHDYVIFNDSGVKEFEESLDLLVNEIEAKP